MDNKKILYLIGAVILVLLLGNFMKTSFSILPAGQYNSDANCTFMTNNEPLALSYNQYRVPSVWISVDADKNGQFEGYGFAGQGSGTGRTNVCTSAGNSQSYVLKENYNQMGDDIYVQYYSAQSQFRIYLCNIDGSQYTFYKPNVGAASSAILGCQPQANSCSIVGEKRCTPTFGTSSYIECLPSGRWSDTAVNCQGGLVCSNNQCTQPTSCIPNWQTGAWSSCASGIQTRTVTDSNNCGTVSGRPATSQTCVDTVLCTANNYQSVLSDCVSNQQTRTWSKIGTCTGGVPQPTNEVIACNSALPDCVYTYSDWSACLSSSIRTRTLTNSPTSCIGSPVVSESCNYVPPTNTIQVYDSLTNCTLKTITSTAKTNKDFDTLSSCQASLPKPGLTITEMLTKYWWILAILLGIIVLVVIKR